MIIVKYLVVNYGLPHKQFDQTTPKRYRVEIKSWKLGEHNTLLFVGWIEHRRKEVLNYCIIVSEVGYPLKFEEIYT